MQLGGARRAREEGRREKGEEENRREKDRRREESEKKEEERGERGIQTCNLALHGTKWQPELKVVGGAVSDEETGGSRILVAE